MASNVLLPCCGYILHPEFKNGERLTVCPACGTPFAVRADHHEVIEYTVKPARMPDL